MCGRYSFAPKPKQLQESLADLLLPDQLEISFNIAPTQQAYVVTSELPARLKKMEWGLVPSWSKDGKNSGKMINARSETIDEKPAFHDAFLSRRCLVPADSFYEWRKEPDGRKTPFRIFLRSEELMFMAGIWERWKQGNIEKYTFSILTTTPNQEMSELHNRMPVILADKFSRSKWLKNEPMKTLLPLLNPVQDHSLVMYAVSDKLNKVSENKAELQIPVEPPLRLF
ncbi:MAG: SOS response-associated peptidase [Saprospiraceae bacterium]|nr:SOS response-associated peptidase [Saprospiraceae bacterium]